MCRRLSSLMEYAKPTPMEQQGRFRWETRLSVYAIHLAFITVVVRRNCPQFERYSLRHFVLELNFSTFCSCINMKRNQSLLVAGAWWIGRWGSWTGRWRRLPGTRTPGPRQLAAGWYCSSS
jgi:hypothetical protein